MKKIFFSTKIIWIGVFSAISQITQILPSGFPDRSPKLDVLQGFKTPTKGYSELHDWEIMIKPAIGYSTINIVNRQSY